MRHRFACVLYQLYVLRYGNAVSHLHTDVFLAITTPDGWFDDLVVGDSHVQVGDYKQGKADSEKVENVLDKESVNKSEKRDHSVFLF